MNTKETTTQVAKEASEPPLQRFVRRPLLWCDHCAGATRHEFSHVTDDNGFEWAEFYKCRVCGTQRKWGASDPVKLDANMASRQRMATKTDTWTVRCDSNNW